jgi:hypothetical protein
MKGFLVRVANHGCEAGSCTRFSLSRRLTLKVGILLLAWVVMTGLAWADTIDLTG